LLERNGESGRLFKGLAVNPCDGDCENLGGITSLGVVSSLVEPEAGRLPFQVQVVLEIPGILFDIGD
jgi:hypothetical protein